MGLTQSSNHKRRKTGGKRPFFRKKRKFELGRQPTNTKIGEQSLKKIRVRGGGVKVRALRLNSGNFSWKSQDITKNLKILDVVYNASSAEMMRAKKLVKSAIIEVESAPFKEWWQCYYKNTPEDSDMVDKEMKFQFGHGYLYARVTSRPGQVGLCNGYILEGDELKFYLQKIKSKH